MNKYVQLSKKFNNQFWISETDYRFFKAIIGKLIVVSHH